MLLKKLFQMENWNFGLLVHNHYLYTMNNNTMYDLEITFWNEGDDTTKVIELTTSYPEYKDVEDTLELNGLDDFKSNGGNYDFFDVKVLEE